MEDLAAVAETLSSLEVKVLLAFADQQALLRSKAQEQSELPDSQFRTAVEMLKSRQALEAIEEGADDFVSLSESGQKCAKERMPELHIIESLQSGASTTNAELRSQVTAYDPAEIGSAIGALKKQDVIAFGADGAVVLNKDKLEASAVPVAQALLEKLAAAEPAAVAELSPAEQAIVLEGSKKRGKAKGLFIVKTVKHIKLLLTADGQKLLAALQQSGLTGDEIGRLTPQMLADGSWRQKRFRKYNLGLKPSRIVVGRLNAYRQYLDFLQEQMISLGFEEMQGSFAEPEFWNMDALFMPQFHSAREIHDVYFVKEPTHAKEIPQKYLDGVAAAHENGGGTGSRGWGYKFDREQARRLILRSQGTVLSARQLASNPKVPGKYFALARCFRYDQVDASHAPDFFQIEGIVLDPNATFKTLLGLLETFAVEIAKAREIKFVPGYFPFTEPSVEVHMKHPTLGWIELGGSGIFRPELTRPLGIDVPVLAWGLGTDRMAMVALGVNDIRDLFSTDLDFLRNSRIEGTL